MLHSLAVACLVVIFIGASWWLFRFFAKWFDFVDR